MLPDHSLSSQPITDEFIYSQDVDTGHNFQYQEGGPEFRNPVEGITGTVWKIRVLENKHVYLSSLTFPEQKMFEGNFIHHMSFAFDVNMNPVYTYLDTEECFIRWYDTAIGAENTISLGSDIATPTLDLDDRREMFFSNSDVILSYIKKDDLALYHRIQRERFTIERKLHDGPFLGIVKTGMNKKLRFQYKLIPLIHRDEYCNVIESNP